MALMQSATEARFSMAAISASYSAVWSRSAVAAWYTAHLHASTHITGQACVVNISYPRHCTRKGWVQPYRSRTRF